MPGETTGAATVQATEAAQPRVGAASSSQAEGAQSAQEAGATAESGTGNADLATLAREREEARREAQRLRAEVRRLTEARTAEDDAKLSELEKANKRVAELERQASESQVREQERSVRLAAVETATRLNFRNPDLAYRLLERSDVEFADDGHPKNVQHLLKAVLDRDPYLAKTAQADFGGGQRGTTPPDRPSMNELLRAAARGG